MLSQYFDFAMGAYPKESRIAAAKRNAVGGKRKRCTKGKNCSAACIAANMVCLVDLPWVGPSLTKVVQLIKSRKAGQGMPAQAAAPAPMAKAPAPAAKPAAAPAPAPKAQPQPAAPAPTVKAAAPAPKPIAPAPKAKPQPAAPTPAAQPKAKPEAKPQQKKTEGGPGESKIPSKMSDEKLKAAFDKSVAAVEAAEMGMKKLKAEGVGWKDPRYEAVSDRLGKARKAVETIRQAYYAVDRDRFLRESAEVTRLNSKRSAILKEVKKEADKKGLNIYALPGDHPLVKRLNERGKLHDQIFYEVEPRRKAAFYGEPATVAKAKSDGGGQVDSSVPLKVPKGGASRDLKDFLNGSEVVMAFNPYGLAKFVKEGEAKNGFQEGTGGIKKGKGGYLEVRKAGEEKVMGISRQTEASKRPVYGALEHPDRARSLQGGENNDMANYGGVQVVLKSSVKDRATFTIGDSLDYNAPLNIMASPVRDPADPTIVNSMGSKKINFNPGGGTSSDKMTTFANFDAGPTRPAYVEAQIHGGLKISDVKEVRYYKGHDIPASTRKLLEKQGVKIVELPPQMDSLSLYSSDPGYKDITTIPTKK